MEKLNLLWIGSDVEEQTLDFQNQRSVLPPWAATQTKLRATILLYDGDARHRESVKLSLEGRGHRVAAYDSRLVEKFFDLRQKVNNADLVIFDLTILDHDIIWSKLSMICGLRGPNGLPPRVGCSSRIDRGAAFELCVNRLGSRFANAK